MNFFSLRATAVDRCVSNIASIESIYSMRHNSKAPKYFKHDFDFLCSKVRQMLCSSDTLNFEMLQTTLKNKKMFCFNLELLERRKTNSLCICHFPINFSVVLITYDFLEGQENFFLPSKKNFLFAHRFLLEIKTFGLGSRTRDVCSKNRKI